MTTAREQEKESRYIGKSPIRNDFIEKVTGQAKFSGDFRPDGLTYGVIVTSPYAHARILNIDTSEAEKMPGYVGIVTGKDVPDMRYGGYIRDRHILCKEITRYVGDYVAVVVATSEAYAKDIAIKVKVDYEELPAVFDVNESFAEDYPVHVHEGLFSYVGTGFQERDIETFGLSRKRPNQFTAIHHDYGDVDKGFEESDLVIENTYTFPLASHCTMETHHATVIPGNKGELTVYASAQAGHQEKYDLAAALEMEPSRIHYHIPYVGGGFGAKTGSTESYVAAVAALKLGKPVRIAQTRQECFESGEPRCSGNIYIKDGYTKTGKLKARYIDARINGGAYSTHALTLVLCLTMGPLGNYYAENLRMDAYGIFTNTPPTGPYRALGGELTTFAAERNMTQAAKKLGISQEQIRLINVLEDGMNDSDRRLVRDNGSKGCLMGVINKFDVDHKRTQEGPWVYGKSITLANKFIGIEDPVGSSATVRIYDDGWVDLANFHVELGQGANTTDAMFCAETLNIPYEKVRLIRCDSDRSPYGMGTFCSRGTFLGGNAAIKAAEDAKRQLFEMASKRLNVPASRLETKDYLIWDKENPEINCKWSDLIRMDGTDADKAVLVGNGRYQLPYKVFLGNPEDHNPWSYSFGAWGIEVAVNKDTGEVKLVDLQGTYDCGKVVNRKSCEGQIEGSFSMGLGQACYEEILLNDQGKVINGSYRDYKIPTFMDGPRNADLHFDFYEGKPHTYGPGGAKGIGEVAMIPVIAGVANAVSDAVGAELYDLPFTRERILNAIEAKEKEETDGVLVNVC